MTKGRTKAHSSNQMPMPRVTKVIGLQAALCVLLAASVQGQAPSQPQAGPENPGAATSSAGQVVDTQQGAASAPKGQQSQPGAAAPQKPTAPSTTPSQQRQGSQNPHPGATAPHTSTETSRVLSLYQQLRSVGLDAERVYKVREAVIDREDLHVYLTDGTLAFLKSVDGRITGAVFDGEGEVLIKPPDRTERSSLGLFTGLGILNDHFSSAYFRFNDDTAQELQARLIPTDEFPDFVARFETTARALGQADAIRLLSTYVSDFSHTQRPRDRMLHARLNTREHGNYDVYYDSMAEEQIVVGQLASGEATNYDLWMAFPGRKTRLSTTAPPPIGDPWRSTFSVRVDKYTVSTKLLPPTELESEAKLDLHAIEGGQGLLVFELSRYLRVQEVTLDGKPLRFLQNESLEGSELAKRGNDAVVVLLPEPLKRDQRAELFFRYGGSVMSDAGNGLIYVGPRGTWYPNRGLAMSHYDLTFSCPVEWTLIATGKLISQETIGEFEVGRWVSENPMPLAGFNLGRYVRRRARSASGDEVQAYAVEKAVAPTVKTPTPKMSEGGALGRGGMQSVLIETNEQAKPVDTVQAVANSSAQALDFYSKRFGPYPYDGLSITQMPTNHSQGWPGLIFLSSLVYLTPQERQKMKMNRYENLLFGELMLSHEAAHQWWGGLVSWRSYRDQWISEALANYSGLMMMEPRNPEDVRHVLDRYRADLEFKAPVGKPYKEAGPVTLGIRLSSSKFPQGYEIISYERGTWLMHMLRTMLRDGATLDGRRGKKSDPEEPFARALRSVCEKYAFKEVGIPELKAAFEAELPRSVRFEGKKSLDWFFETWVNGTDVPKIEMRNTKISRAGTSTMVSGMLVQSNAAEDLVTSVPIYGVVKTKQVLLGRVFADGKESTFQLRGPAGVTRVVMDPQGTVLMSGEE
jgi:hypothetical protein